MTTQAYIPSDMSKFHYAKRVSDFPVRMSRSVS